MGSFTSNFRRSFLDEAERMIKFAHLLDNDHDVFPRRHLQRQLYEITVLKAVENHRLSFDCSRPSAA